MVFFLIILHPAIFLHLLMVFHWSLSDSKSPLVSRTFQSILTNFSCAVVGMVSILRQISSSLSLFSMFLGIVPRALTIIGTIVISMLHRLFCSLARSGYFPSLSVYFTLNISFTGMVKFTSQWFFFFLLNITRSGLFAGIRWSICISKFQKILYLIF